MPEHLRPQKALHLDRIVAIILLWGMRFGLAWLVTYEYLALAGEKLESVVHALGKI
jgi:hypothetical protein